jgi:hypothetical protein
MKGDVAIGLQNGKIISHVAHWLPSKKHMAPSVPEGGMTIMYVQYHA